MFRSGFLIRGHRPSCFRAGIPSQWPICFHVTPETRSFVSLSICTRVNSKSVATHSVWGQNTQMLTLFMLFFFPYYYFFFFQSHTITSTDNIIRNGESCVGRRVVKSPALKKKKIHYIAASCVCD